MTWRQLIAITVLASATMIVALVGCRYSYPAHYREVSAVIRIVYAITLAIVFYRRICVLQYPKLMASIPLLLLIADGKILMFFNLIPTRVMHEFVFPIANLVLFCFFVFFLVFERANPNFQRQLEGAARKR